MDGTTAHKSSLGHSLETKVGNWSGCGPQNNTEERIRVGVEGQVDCDLRDLFDNNEVSSFTNDIADIVGGGLFCLYKQTVK